MDLRGLVWKRVRKITFVGLKLGQDLENRAAHPHQEFLGVPPPPPRVWDSYVWEAQRDAHLFFPEQSHILQHFNGILGYHLDFKFLLVVLNTTHEEIAQRYYQN